MARAPSVLSKMENAGARLAAEKIDGGKIWTTWPDRDLRLQFLSRQPNGMLSLKTSLRALCIFRFIFEFPRLQSRHSCRGHKTRDTIV